MKLDIQYLNDLNGNIKAVQLPYTEWEKLLHRLKKSEQILKIKSDLREAFAEVEKIKKGEVKKQTLADFLNDL